MAVPVQLTLDDCAPDWPAPEPKQPRPRHRRYRPGRDLDGQRLPDWPHRRIVTVHLTGSYL